MKPTPTASATAARSAPEPVPALRTAAAARAALRAAASPRDAAVLQRFFKTGPGEYGEGDRFLGVRVPRLRALARAADRVPFGGVLRLLASPVHEERLLALLMLVRRYERGADADRRRVFDAYLARTRFIDNWDLVDLSAPNIVGAHLVGRPRRRLDRLARSPSLWERRIAVVATHAFIRRGEHGDTLRIAAALLGDREDLIHKAAGWMLREVAKRDPARAEAFVRRHAARMPRTMLRYAIERFPPAERRRLMALPRADTGRSP